MISLLLGMGSLAAAIVWGVKGEIWYAIGFLACCALFMNSWHMSLVNTQLKDILELNKDKVLAEKTLSTLIAASRKVEDDGK